MLTLTKNITLGPPIPVNEYSTVPVFLKSRVAGIARQMKVWADLMNSPVPHEHLRQVILIRVQVQVTILSHCLGIHWLATWTSSSYQTKR